MYLKREDTRSALWQNGNNFSGPSHTLQQWQYQLNNKQVAAPWQIQAPPSSPTKAPSTMLTPQPKQPMIMPMDRTAIRPAISPALPGEGMWSVLENASGQYNLFPLDA